MEMLIALCAGLGAGLAGLVGSLVGTWVSMTRGEKSLKLAGKAIEDESRSKDRLFQLEQTKTLSQVAKALAAATGATHYNARLDAAKEMIEALAGMTTKAGKIYRVERNDPNPDPDGGRPVIRSWFTECENELGAFNRGAASLRVIGGDDANALIDEFRKLLVKLEDGALEEAAEGLPNSPIGPARTKMMKLQRKIEAALRDDLRPPNKGPEIQGR